MSDNIKISIPHKSQFSDVENFLKENHLTSNSFGVFTQGNLANCSSAIATDNDVIVGFLAIENNDDSAKIIFSLNDKYDLDVTGKQLIKGAKSELRYNGIRSLSLEINKQHLAVFESCAGKLVKDIDDSTVLISLNLVKELPKHTIENIIEKLKDKSQYSTTKPKVLFLYGSNRENSFSHKLAKSAAKIIESFGAETRIFDPKDIPIANTGLTQNPDESALPKSVIELRNAVSWCEAMVWISPEIHGAMSATFKNMIDWLPLTTDAVRSCQGKVVALMQVSGGSQTFNAVNQMRILGRWMRGIVIPNQSSIPTAYNQFHEDGELMDTFYRDRVIDVMEELMRMTILLRDNIPLLVDRWGEKKLIDSDEPRPLITFQGPTKSLS